MRVFIALLAIMAISAAACDGHVSYVVPAVVGNSGGLVNVTMSLVPGEGNVFTSVYPKTGLMTQDSIVEAVTYALKLAKEKEKCDVIVNFGNTANEIEGPSAGAAMTVMAFALFEDRALRNDTVITGTIEPDGSVGPVGGLYEKAKGAASIHARYFITPVENLYELLLLKDLERQYGLQVLQARSVDELIGFMIFNESIPQEELVARIRPIPELEKYDTGVPQFRSVAKKMIDIESSLASNITESDNDTSIIKQFFENEVERQNSELEDGYTFSAANEAFLNYIDLSTIRVIQNKSADLPRKKGEAGICLSRVKRPGMTDENFEWVVGSDLRTAWADERLRSTDVTGDFLADESYIVYNELMYAQAWCYVALELTAATPSSGKAINESAWEPLASAKLREAGALGTTDEDSASRLSSAQNSYSHGRYGAAIFDAVYVIESQDTANATGILNESRDSLWGRIYQSHALFLAQQNQTSAAIRTARLAKGLDGAVKDMRAAIAYPSAPAAPPEAPAPAAEPGDGSGILYMAAAALLFLLVIVVILLIIYGKPKGPLKAYGAREKKGRA
ncbi:MAG TPA: S16 family serine protease [Candidatus Bilamarchaeum sp.]|nr:S16 family serine protease [Candidatus Bilamarchaeum sp.]